MGQAVIFVTVFSAENLNGNVEGKKEDNKQVVFFFFQERKMTVENTTSNRVRTSHVGFSIL